MSSAPDDTFPRRKLFKLAGGTIAAGALMGAGGCGLLGGSQGAATQPKGNLEKGSIKVAVLADTAVAPVFLAKQNGYFQQEGLQVDLVQAASGPVALNGMIGGDYDIAYSSYVPFFAAQASGVAPLKIVTDAASLPSKAFMLMVAKDSPFKAPQDLANKTIAVSDVHTISDLLVLSMFRAHGVNPTVQWARTPFPSMTTAIAQKHVDAIAVVEPFVTTAARTVGALPLVDLGDGPAQDFPLTGFGTTEKFASQNPNTLRAFQRAHARATADAQDRGKIQPFVQTANKIDEQTASLITLLTMRSTADATRLQRVVQLMKEFDFINKDVDVASMILPQSPA
jgi:NitT/TauT family transport system substrate-binding protein